LGLVAANLPEISPFHTESATRRQQPPVCPTLAVLYLEQYRISSGHDETGKTATKMENKNEGAIFPKGEKAPADYFTGTQAGN